MPAHKQRPQASSTSASPSADRPFKSYMLPNGEVIDLTIQEFTSLIEVFRMLVEKQQNLESQGLISSIGYQECVEGECSNSDSMEKASDFVKKKAANE